MSTTAPPSSPQAGTSSPAGPVVVEELRAELQAWAELSPLGQLVFDGAGAIVRHNAAFARMLGTPAGRLDDAVADLGLLLGWPGELPGAGATRTREGWLVDARGKPMRVRVQVRGVGAGPQGQDASASGRWIALFEDRNLEDERDVARIEIQALMGTAGIGVATWDAARGWVGAVWGAALAGAAQEVAARSGQGGLMAVGRELVEPDSLPDYERLQAALRARSRIEVRYAVRPPEGGRRWLMTRVEPAELGAQRGAFTVVTVDVTEEETARRRNQDLIAELESLAREGELMFNLPDVGIAYQRDGRIERVNQALADLVGAKIEWLQRAPMASLYEDERAWRAASESDERELRLFGRSHGERRIRRRDGTLFWAQVSQRPVSLERPQDGTIVSFVNIDDRQRARESLVAQSDRTRAILDSVLVGIVTVGAAGIEWMNRSARRMFGGELADFVGAPMSVVATDEPDHPLRRTDYGETLEEGQAETFECRLRARDGRNYWVVGNVVVTGQDTAHPQLTFALLDIERRRQAEVSIAQARASLQRIIETAPLAIALFDAGSQQVVQLNQMMATFAARPVGEILGRMPAQWLPGPEAARLSADLDRALASPDSVQRELRRGGAAPAGEGAQDDEAPRVWDIRIVALRSQADASDQLLMVASDVTAQRAADEARFAAAIAHREMLIKEVHHRIKNNLQGVAGLLQQSAFRHPEAAGAIAEAVSQVHAIAQVHGLQVGVTGPMRVGGVVEAIAQSVQRMFGRTINVEVCGPALERFALTEADSIPIALTINELFTNAIKHSAPAENAAAPDVECRVECGEAEIAIAIANRGTLVPGFSLAAVPPGVSGLGLVRSLLPRKGARMTLAADGPDVVARLELAPPAVALLAP
jgi:PAS domain S-box-containing protein